MSFILDALKRADSERHFCELPGLHTRAVSQPVQALAAGPRRARAILLALATTFGFIVIGILVWPNMTAPTVPSLVLLAAPALQNPAEPVVASALPVPLPAPKQAALPKIDTIEKPLRKAEPALSEPTGIMTLSDLPQSIRRELPALAVSGTMYSNNPADRMLLLDKQMLHEGDEIAPGLVLESVRPKGATLRYKGYLFRISR